MKGRPIQSEARERRARIDRLHELQQYHRRDMAEIEAEISALELEAVGEADEHVDRTGVVTVGVKSQ